MEQIVEDLSISSSGWLEEGSGKPRETSCYSTRRGARRDEGRVAELAIGRCRRSSINCFLFFTVTYQQKRTEEPFALRSSVHSFRHYACATNSRKSSSKPTWARYTIHRFSVRKPSHTRTLWTFLDDLQDQPTVLPPFSNFHRRDVRRAK